MHSAKKNDLKISLSTKKVSKFLLSLFFGLHLISIIVNLLSSFQPDSTLVKGLVKLFDVDGEGNLASLYSVAILLICVVLLALISIIEKQNRSRYFGHWMGLTIIFTYIAWDEAVEIHEKLMDAPILYQLMEFLELERRDALTFPWVIMGILLVILFALVYFKFWLNLPPRTKRLFFISASLYVGGAVGMEMLGGLILGHPDKISTAKENILYILSVSFEEMLETLGIILFVYSLLLYGNSLLKKIVIKVNN